LKPVQQPKDQTSRAAKLEDGGGDLAADPSALFRTHRGIASAASTWPWNLG
jgi:hypothetical protein